MTHTFSTSPKQLLDRSCYTDENWFAKEREQFHSRTWQFACMEFDVPNPGDYQTLNIAGYPLFVMRNANGELSAWHNICRHRGTELLEGKGNTGKTIVCPYHRWTYGLDGNLRGIPDRAECFANFERGNHNLLPIGLGRFKEMVFINISDEKSETFSQWISPLSGHEWPHEISSSKLKGSDPFHYEMKCNWKVFFENAVDGYHLAYLHENTLGGPTAGANVWDIHGQNLIWYSTERDQVKNRIPKFVEDQASGSGIKTIEGADTPGYGGVYMLFPTLIIAPSPWSLTISVMRPISAERTDLLARTWVPDSWLGYKEGPESAPGYDKETKTIRSENWTQPALETSDFQTEDIWVCEKMQRSLNSPAYGVGQMASGSGGEAAIEIFQRNILDYMGQDG